MSDANRVRPRAVNEHYNQEDTLWKVSHCRQFHCQFVRDMKQFDMFLEISLETQDLKDKKVYMILDMNPTGGGIQVMDMMEKTIINMLGPEKVVKVQEFHCHCFI